MPDDKRERKISERARAGKPGAKLVDDMPEAERRESQFSNDPRRIVSDWSVANAIDCLRDTAKLIGQARRRMVLAEARVKSVEALLILKSEETTELKRKSDARASELYERAITEHAIAAGEFEELRARREAATAAIEAWRSEQANYRGIKL